MKQFSCPSCGAEIVFQSSASVFAVCKYCKSTLVRKDMNLENLGKMADLKDDATPFQVGTTGKFQGDFIFIGRVRVSWDEGFWNEWFIRYSDGKEAWLAEAQGFYMVSFQVEAKVEVPAEDNLTIDLPIQIGNLVFEVNDIKKVQYSFAEGELPFAAPQGFKGTSVDLVNGENNFASLSYGENGEVDIFVGQYVDFEKFHFQNLRQIDGW